MYIITEKGKKKEGAHLKSSDEKHPRKNSSLSNLEIPNKLHIKDSNESTEE